MSTNLATRWAPAPALAAGRCVRRPPVAAAASSNRAASREDESGELGVDLPRRQLLALSLLAPAAAALAALPAAADEPVADAAPEPAAAAAAAAGPTTYVDAEDAFTIEVPAGWVQGSGTIGDAGTLTSSQARFSNAAGLRRVVAFLPEDNPKVGVAITIQYLGADYTSLGSFGTAQAFAEGVVTKMDNSYLLKLPEWRRAKEAPVQVARLLDVKDYAKQRYVFSYSVAKEGEPQRTVYQSVAVGWNGRHNRFYTVNASLTGGDVERYGPTLQRVVESFRPPVAAA